MPVVLVQKGEAVHHPLIEPVGGVPSYLAHDVRTLLQPAQLAAGRRRKDVDRAILAAVAVFRYVFAIESETSWSVVW
jgi:hypothetical protein